MCRLVYLIFQDGCKALVESLTVVLHNVNDPVSSWEKPVEECFDEAHKKIRLAFECGPKLEQVCLDYFEGTVNYDEAVSWRGSFETKLSGGSSLTPSLFVLLLVVIVKLSARIGV